MWERNNHRKKPKSYHLFFIYCFRQMGSQCWGHLSIVFGGEDSNILAPCGLFFKGTLHYSSLKWSTHIGSDLNRMFCLLYPRWFKGIFAGLTWSSSNNSFPIHFPGGVRPNWLYSHCPADMSKFLRLFMSINKYFVNTSAMGWMCLLSFNLA